MKRKDDHIDLARSSQVSTSRTQLNYEPILSGHPKDLDLSCQFMGHYFAAPIWFSSMTGGVSRGKAINRNLAKICHKYKLGMGLGSCRSLLSSQERIGDFDVRELMPKQALYMNLGIAQVSQLVRDKQLTKIEELRTRLQYTGLIIHVNPLQEWTQPEGDRYYQSPLEIIKLVLKESDIPIIIKEVGQGMGPRSLKALAQLPLQAIEFAALGGTNFTLLETKRAQNDQDYLAHVGHTAKEMVGFVNEMDKDTMQCKNFIISGGIQNSLVGYELMSSCSHESIFAYGSKLLNYAHDLGKLDEFVHREIENLKLAHAMFEAALP